MSIPTSRKTARARALRDFQNPDEPWTAAVVREHLAHVRREAKGRQSRAGTDDLDACKFETEAYCAEFTRLWEIRKANTTKHTDAYMCRLKL